MRSAFFFGGGLFFNCFFVFWFLLLGCQKLTSKQANKNKPESKQKQISFSPLLIFDVELHYTDTNVAVERKIKRKDRKKDSILKHRVWDYTSFSQWTRHHFSAINWWMVLNRVTRSNDFWSLLWCMLIPVSAPHS